MGLIKFENEYFKVLNVTNERSASGRVLYNVLCKKCSKEKLLHSQQIKSRKSCGCGSKKLYNDYENDYIKVIGMEEEKSTKSHKYWIVECKKCMEIFSIRSDNLETFKNCNKCEMLHFENDNIKVLKSLRSDEYGRIYLAECKHCGNEIEIYGGRLQHFSNCGCFRERNRVVESNIIIEKNSDKDCLHKIYYNLKQKYNKHNIKISESWDRSFENFYNDVKESYNNKVKLYGEEIEFVLINPSKNFGSNNFIWSNKKQIIKKNKSMDQSYFRATKGDREIVAYNKGVFSRIVMNHYRKDNSIRSVITGKCKSWHGWQFIEITKNTGSSPIPAQKPSPNSFIKSAYTRL